MFAPQLPIQETAPQPSRGGQATAGSDAVVRREGSGEFRAIVDRRRADGEAADPEDSGAVDGEAAMDTGTSFGPGDPGGVGLGDASPSFAQSPEDAVAPPPTAATDTSGRAGAAASAVAGAEIDGAGVGPTVENREETPGSAAQGSRAEGEFLRRARAEAATRPVPAPTQPDVQAAQRADLPAKDGVPVPDEPKITAEWPGGERDAARMPAPENSTERAAAPASQPDPNSTLPNLGQGGQDASAPAVASGIVRDPQTTVTPGNAEQPAIASPAPGPGSRETAQTSPPPVTTAQLAEQRDLRQRKPVTPQSSQPAPSAAESGEEAAVRAVQTPVLSQAAPVQPAIPAAPPATEPMARQSAVSEVAVTTGSDLSMPDMAPAERGGTDAAQRTATALTTPPELPRAIAAQIIEAMRAGTGIVDVTLWPEELGRLTLSLAAQESAMSVTVAADRPETLELIRRHMDVLLEEARSAGFSDVAFGFAGDGGAGTDAEKGEDAKADASALAETRLWEAPEAPRTSAAPGRLDLRI